MMNWADNLLIQPSPDESAPPAAWLRESLFWHAILARTGDNIVGELLKGNDAFYEWDHYPENDVYDEQTHAQYYYHAHPVEDRVEGEHGHFHTFVRDSGTIEGFKPVAHAEGADEDLCHLVGISMDEFGYPFRLFTSNLWVTGGRWYGADKVKRLLHRFEIAHARPSWPVNRWISALLRAFRPQIHSLLEERDRIAADWRAARPGENIWEDRDLNVVSEIRIDLQTPLGEALRNQRQGIS
ncbi:MAG: hypothetical protein RIE22_07810 [Alphaproteobacteria bacterium]